jgi:integrase
MANKADLIRRNSRWYFNKAYPKDLWPFTGKAPFRTALKTDSLEVAIRARPEAERLYWSKVDALRAEHKGTARRELTEIESMGIVARWFREEDAERTAELEETRSPLMDINGTLEELEELDGAAREAIAEADYNGVRPLAERLAEEAGYSFDPRPKASKRLMAALLRGRRELLLMEQARLLGDYAVQPKDPLIQYILTNQSPVTGKQRTVKEMVDGFVADNQVKWSKATRKATEAPLRILLEFFGAERDPVTITRDEGRALHALLVGLPVNYTKRKELRGLSLTQCVEKAKGLGLPTLSPKTINDTYAAYIGGAFRWALREGWITLNPVDGLSVVDTVAAEDKRAPFTVDQLNALFRSGPWVAPKEEREADPLRYWGPLVALFQGMRRGEIAQLHVADVEELDGAMVIRVRPSADGKRVKSAAGRRVLPVHPELVKLGFLSYVDRQREAGHKQLFPNEVPNKSGHWGDSMGKWFSRHVEELGFEGVKLGMHSFRHNFEDALRAAGLHGTPLGQELAGRAKQDRVSGGYGSGRFPVSQLKPAIESVRYHEVKLPHLYE